jgi:hypothetical protein
MGNKNNALLNGQAMKNYFLVEWASRENNFLVTGSNALLNGQAVRK